MSRNINCSPISTSVVEFFVLAFVGAFFAAALTVPAGFGLSTMLTPMVLLMMGPHEAVAVVAVVAAVAVAVDTTDSSAFKLCAFLFYWFNAEC